MIVLALDTTTRAGSVAVVRDGEVMAEYVGDPTRTHGQRLPADLMRALERAGLTPRDLTLLAVAAGPGSFTGLRVGIAAMQGLAVALDLRIVPVQTLDALARAGASGHAPVGAWMDAQRGEVFAALYGSDGRTMLRGATSLPPGETLDTWRADLPSGPIRFVGDGAVRYATVICERLGAGAIIAESTVPLAAVIGQMACEAPERAVVPHAVVPVYVRRPDAELARARRGGAR